MVRQLQVVQGGDSQGTKLWNVFSVEMDIRSVWYELFISSSSIIPSSPSSDSKAAHLKAAGRILACLTRIAEPAQRWDVDGALMQGVQHASRGRRWLPPPERALSHGPGVHVQRPFLPRLLRLEVRHWLGLLEDGTIIACP